jgi:ketosteroid isomerase-like protein
VPQRAPHELTPSPADVSAGDEGLRGVWSFNGTGPDGEPVQLAANNADVLRRQPDGSWRFVIDNPWGTD